MQSLFGSAPLKYSHLVHSVVALVMVLVVSGCGIYEYDDSVPEPDPAEQEVVGIFEKGGLLGPSTDFGDEYLGAGDSGRIGVNAFLWRASLDTVSFMPISSVDAFGGVIISDWQTSNASSNERFKMNVYILGRALRADGIRVSVFRQVQTAPGQWQDAGVPAEMNTKVEDAILTKARQMRSAALATR